MTQLPFVTVLVAGLLCAAPAYAQDDDYARQVAQERRQAEFEAPQLAKVLGLKLGMTVADIGTGGGAVAMVLGRLIGSGRVYATDITQRSLTTTREYANLFVSVPRGRAPSYRRKSTSTSSKRRTSGILVSTLARAEPGSPWRRIRSDPEAKQKERSATSVSIVDSVMVSLAPFRSFDAHRRPLLHTLRFLKGEGATPGHGAPKRGGGRAIGLDRYTIIV